MQSTLSAILLRPRMMEPVKEWAASSKFFGAVPGGAIPKAVRESLL